MKLFIPFEVLAEAQERMKSVELKVESFAALEAEASKEMEMVEKKKEARKARPRLGSARKITEDEVRRI